MKFYDRSSIVSGEYLQSVSCPPSWRYPGINGIKLLFCSSLIKRQIKLKHLSLVSFSTCDLYNKPMMIVNDDSRVINRLETSLTDDGRVVICDHHMFIIQATGLLFVG
jgi:hypothetical protein